MLALRFDPELNSLGLLRVTARVRSRLGLNRSLKKVKIFCPSTDDGYKRQLARSEARRFSNSTCGGALREFFNSLLVHPLEDRGDALTATDAHRHQRAPRAG